MKLIFKNTVLKLLIYANTFLVFFISEIKLIAQQEMSLEEIIDLNNPLENQLPSLDSLINVAIANHPTVKVNEALIGSAETRVKIAKKSWSNLFRVYADYGYGNQAILYASGSDLSNIANGYRPGANLSIPLPEIFIRGHRIDLKKQE